MTTFYPSILGEQARSERCGCKIASVMLYQSSSTYDRTKQLIPLKLDQFNLKAEGDNIRIGKDILYKGAIIFYQPDLKDVIEVTKSFDMTGVKFVDSFTYQGKTIKPGTLVVAKDGQLIYRNTILPDDYCEREKLLKNLMYMNSSSLTFETYQISLVSSTPLKQTIQLDLVTQETSDTNPWFYGWSVSKGANFLYSSNVYPVRGTYNQFELSVKDTYYIGCTEAYTIYGEPHQPGSAAQEYFVGIIQKIPFPDGSLPMTVDPNVDPDVFVYCYGTPYNATKG